MAMLVFGVDRNDQASAWLRYAIRDEEFSVFVAGPTVYDYGN
jgi:hypothetical protein